MLQRGFDGYSEYEDTDMPAKVLKLILVYSKRLFDLTRITKQATPNHQQLDLNHLRHGCSNELAHQRE